MKSIKLLLLISLIIISLASFGQATEEAEMADALRRDGKIYTVVMALVIILSAMIVLLIRVDRKIFRLEKKENSK